MDIKEWEKKWDEVARLRIDRKEYTTTHYYKNGKKIATVNGGDTVEIFEMHVFSEFDPSIINREFLDSFTKVKETIEDNEGLNKARKEATGKLEQFWNDFKNALFEYHGIENHPKREKFFQILRSNSKTPYEIFGEAEEWVGLIK